MKLNVGDVLQCKNTNAQWIVRDIEQEDGQAYYRTNMISIMATQGIYEDQVGANFVKVSTEKETLNHRKEILLELLGDLRQYYWHSYQVASEKNREYIDSMVKELAEIENEINELSTNS